MTTKETTVKERFAATHPRATLLDGHLYFSGEDMLSFISSECERARGEAIDEVRDLASEILDEVFPKTNQDNPEEASENGRAFAMVYYGFLLGKLRSLTHTKL